MTEKAAFLFGPLVDGSDRKELSRSLTEFMRVGYETRTPESVMLELAKAFSVEREINYRSDNNNISNCSVITEPYDKEG